MYKLISLKDLKTKTWRANKSVEAVGWNWFKNILYLYHTDRQESELIKQ